MVIMGGGKIRTLRSAVTTITTMLLLLLRPTPPPWCCVSWRTFSMSIAMLGCVEGFFSFPSALSASSLSLRTSRTTTVTTGRSVQVQMHHNHYHRTRRRRQSLLLSKLFAEEGEDTDDSNSSSSSSSSSSTTSYNFDDDSTIDTTAWYEDNNEDEYRAGTTNAAYLGVSILEHRMDNVEIVPHFSTRPQWKAAHRGSGGSDDSGSGGRHNNDNNDNTAQMLRGSANYIAKYRGTTVVLHVPAKLFDIHDTDAEASSSAASSAASSTTNNNVACKKLVDDISLLWLLGTKVVIVIGVRKLVEERSRQYYNTTEYEHKLQRYEGSCRVIDETDLRIIKEVAGYARFELESQLARALKRVAGSGGGGGGGATHQELDNNVVSGNFFSAQPIGVREGIDYQYTGTLRRVEVDKIRQSHDNDDVVIMTSLGVSPSGELFVVKSENLAAGVASKLSADKIIYMLEEPAHICERPLVPTTTNATTYDDNNNNNSNNKHNEIMSIRLSEAKRLLTNFGIDTDTNNKNNQQQTGRSSSSSETSKTTKETPASKSVSASLPAMDQFLENIGHSAMALTNGVRRAHLVCPSDGSLLEELYTRDDGTGTMISRDLYDGIRRATVEDIPGILELIQPLVDAGTLVVRPRVQIEKEIETYYVYTRDDFVVACGQLKLFIDDGGYAEIACLAVRNDYRKLGKGDAMLTFLERVGLKSGATSLFVLSTQTMQWFIERSFLEVDVDDLPQSRKDSYNYQRKSKIYMKRIDGTTDLDEEELMWDNF